MCGICGAFGVRDLVAVRDMLSTLGHRGPDDEFIVSSPDFALGTRRLSIVDVEGGRQPLCNEDGMVWAAHNGELYNFPDIRQELLDRGHHLCTRCDTEVLPHLYEDRGTELFERIDGMFAVAVWDDSRKLGILARDRVGKKPLYYHSAECGLYFASEIKALLAIPGFERRINLEALHHFLGYKHVPHPLSIFDGIFVLPPANILIYRPGRDPEIQRYWSVDFRGSDSMALPETELTERLLSLLRCGVKRRLMADVPVGFFLSGGIDSGLCTALAAELSPGRIRTFTLTYAEGSTTEGKEEDRRWARWISRRYQTEHYEETISLPDFPGSLRRILRCFDEPFSGVVSTYFLAELIGRHVKVAISGDGADELFGSYLSHRLAAPLSHYAEYVRTGNPDLIRPFSDPSVLAPLAGMEEAAWRHELGVFTDREKIQLYAPEVADIMHAFSTKAHLSRQFARLTATDPLNRILEAEFQSFLPDQVLTFVDRLSMAHSLEVRTPFLDTEFVSFVAGLPGESKIRGGETKYILKRAAAKYFPNEMVSRKKEGFVMPVAEWLRRDFESYVRETLNRDHLRKHGMFDVARVQDLVDGFYRGGYDYRYANKLLSLLVFQEWYELYMT